MKKELQEKLYKKYPKIFRQKDLDMSQTCMCWGITCGDGWYKLIDRLCSSLQWDTDENGYPQIEAMQVKEKFGGLRFYTGGAKPYQRGMITFAESLSYHICESCGTMEDVECERVMGWYTTICDKCRGDKKKSS